MEEAPNRKRLLRIIESGFALILSTALVMAVYPSIIPRSFQLAESERFSTYLQLGILLLIASIPFILIVQPKFIWAKYLGWLIFIAIGGIFIAG